MSRRSGTTRRLRNRRSRTFARVLCAVAIVFSCVWLFARMYAERWAAIQWAAWVGVEWVFLVVLVLVGMGWLIYKSSRRRTRKTLWLATLVMLALGVKTAMDWNLHRAFTSQRAHAADDLRFASVNLSAQEVTHWPTLDKQVDVLVVTNRVFNADLEPAWAWVRSESDERDAAIIGRCAVMSRLPIRRYAQTWVNFDDVWPKDGQPKSGWAAWFELEPQTPDADPIVVWVVDLPSPIQISRTLAVKRTLEAIDAWRGIAYTIDENHQRSSMSGARFPLPDVVLGDFNTPRWSRALTPMTDQLHLREVSSSVGIGPSATFPSPRSLWPIDLFYVSDDWQPISHSTIAIEGLRHRAVTMTISPAATR